MSKTMFVFSILNLSGRESLEIAVMRFQNIIADLFVLVVNVKRIEKLRVWFEKNHYHAMQILNHYLTIHCCTVGKSVNIRIAWFATRSQIRHS